MKKTVSGFIRRGLVAWGFGPIVLAVFYLILRHRGLMEALTVEEVCTGIFSLAALAFIAGGMNVVYQMERLPLMVAILIHGSVLYASYLLFGFFGLLLIPVFAVLVNILIDKDDAPKIA